MQEVIRKMLYTHCLHKQDVNTIWTLYIMFTWVRGRGLGVNHNVATVYTMFTWKLGLPDEFEKLKVGCGSEKSHSSANLVSWSRHFTPAHHLRRPEAKPLSFAEKLSTFDKISRSYRCTRGKPPAPVRGKAEQVSERVIRVDLIPDGHVCTKFALVKEYFEFQVKYS